MFKLKSDYSPCGDQPQAIETLVNSIKNNNKFQTLLGVTGSGKTYTMAKIIEKVNKPTLVLAHNKTLAVNLSLFSLIMMLNILYLIMIIISPKHI